MCGRIRAYQWGLPIAFWWFDPLLQQSVTIDDAYFSGVAIMHGSPRQHIWTFAGGPWENRGLDFDTLCPCDTTGTISIQPFVGEDYFCESGLVWSEDDTPTYTLHSSDALWDGRDCHPSSTCCSLHDPPYFTKILSQQTSDDLELRICLNTDKSQSDIAVEVIELFVK